MKRAVAITGVLVALVALALVAAYGGALSRPTPTPEPPPTTRRTPTPAATPRRTASPAITPRASATPVDTSVRASAVVVPQRSADLTVPVSGVVDELFVSEQDTVFANEIVLTLDQSTYVAEVNVAEAAVRRAEAAEDLAQLRLDQLPSDATPAQIETAEADLRLAVAELELARTTLIEAEVALRQTEVRAPFAGTIVSIDIEVGEQAVAGRPLITIADTSRWLVETTDVSELEVVRVTVGDPATVTVGAFPDDVITGTVERIQVRGTSDTGAVVFAVVISPDSHDADLRWNMTASVRITPSG